MSSVCIFFQTELCNMRIDTGNASPLCRGCLYFLTKWRPAEKLTGALQHSKPGNTCSILGLQTCPLYQNAGYNVPYTHHEVKLHISFSLNINNKLQILSKYMMFCWFFLNSNQQKPLDNTLVLSPCNSK